MSTSSTGRSHRFFASLSGLDTYLRCRVCWQLALAVFLCIVAIEGAILVPSVRSFERDLLLRLEESSLNSLAAAVAVRGAVGPEAWTEIGATLMGVSRIRGGVMYDAAGEVRASFGEMPRLDAPPTRASRLGRFVSGRGRVADGTRFDVRWPPALSGLPGDVVMRLDAAWIGSELTSFVTRIALLVFMISVFVSGGAMLVLGRIVLKPMLRVRAAVVAASENPAQADTYSPTFSHRNELGELAAALNRLLVRISRTHREELAMLKAMANETSIAIVACDEDGTSIYANGAALSLTGCESIDEMRDWKLPRFALPGRESTALTLREVLADGAYAGEAALRSVGGDGVVPCYVNAGVLTNDRGQPLRYYATIADISEVREAQEVLRQRNLELATAERAKARFLANMSHEFRTPLNAIIGFSELILEELNGPLVDPKYRGYVEDIRRSGVHLLSVINDVLDMAKIESGAIEIRKSDVFVSDVIDDALRMVAHQAEEKRLNVRVDFDKRTPMIHADELKLRQILLNLVSNSVKFTPSGGTITVSTRPCRRADIGDGLELTVADTGVGIAREDLETVLEPFRQSTAAVHQSVGGTGLGLALCKALVEAHEGIFTLDSKVGRGTVATVCLPARQAVRTAA